MHLIEGTATYLRAVGVRACVGHGEQAGLAVPELEVLVCREGTYVAMHASRHVTRNVGTGSEGRQRVRGQLTSELLAVDRLSTGAVVSCEVPALEHELYRGREATVHTSSHGV